MSPLGPARFASFVEEVTGFSPFPWQQRLLEDVLETGWPDLLDLPTGTGKTTTLLIALYALAVDPSRFHRRIALVVDRRIIVDQVDEFARRLKTALEDPSKPTCHEVATRLKSLCSHADAQPVRVVHLRGGIPRDNTWLGTPDQPTIIASTVDQVGSRLLFRGYGVSEGMRPVHAGVLARDTLYLLDEVHLATAFEETLGQLGGRYQDWAEQGGTGRRLQVVRMSATPRGSDDPSAKLTSFELDDDDRNHPVLARRLGVSRPAMLEVVKTKRSTDAAARASNRARVAEASCARVTDALGKGAQIVGVVVNRVDTARRIAATLNARSDLQMLLLTGRMRPFEKGAIQAKIAAAAGAGTKRPLDALPTVVVATSCIEAGADLDFDALITEAASFDALRQRFGRLNRLGDHPSTQAWILGSKDQLGDQAKPDPIYGTALRETWNYLQEQAKDGIVDFGLEALPLPDPQRLKTLLPTSPEAPVLFPSYLDMWSETRPAPHPDPDPELWLHGKGSEPERDVHLVFRTHLPKASTELHPEIRSAVAEAMEFLPPVADEAVAVPVHELRDFIDDSHVWRWTAEGIEVIELKNDLRRGDTIVVDVGVGGLRFGTWDPSSNDPVEDVAERAIFATRKLAALRIDPAILPEALGQGPPRPPEEDDPEALEDARTKCLEWLNELANEAEHAPESWRALLHELANEDNKRKLEITTSSSDAKTWRVVVLRPKQSAESSTEDAISSFAGAEIPLADHLKDVEAWAESFAQAAGLDASIAADVALAALLHDIGKADPRFQAMLRGGDPIAAAGGPPLAKSRQFGSASARHRAQQRSGWPRGLRHELVSLALLDASPELKSRANDLELVRHLVASHHGWCRPWAPSMLDPRPTSVTVTVAKVTAEIRTDALDQDFAAACASRFRRLCRIYGWHGLAYLEALLRLGDHRASAHPYTRPKEAASS